MSNKPKRNIKRRLVSFAVVALAIPVLLVITVVILEGPGIAPEAQAELEAGQIAYSRGDFDEAEAAYQHALKLAPKNAAVLERVGTMALWKNDLQRAEQYFNQALEYTPAYRNRWPFNAQLMYHLGMTLYRQDRFDEVREFFLKARGPIAVGPFKELDAFAQQVALFENQTPYTIEGPNGTRLDFVTTDPLPVITASVNGHEPVNFIIDTGGMEIVLDRAWADEIGAQIPSALAGTFAGGREAATSLGKVDTITLGEFTIRNVPIHSLEINTPAMSDLFNGLEIHGIIGTRTLMHFVSTIDYPNGALNLQRITPQALQALDEQAAAPETHVIPIWLVETHYILAHGTVNDLEPALFYVDTGLAGKGFTASEDILREAGIDADWSQAQMGFGGGGEFEEIDIVVERVTLGSGDNEVVKTNVPGTTTENHITSQLEKDFGVHIGGLISHQFFHDHAVTFDFTAMRLIIQ